MGDITDSSTTLGNAGMVAESGNISLNLIVNRLLSSLFFEQSMVKCTRVGLFPLFMVNCFFQTCLLSLWLWVFYSAFIAEVLPALAL